MLGRPPHLGEPPNNPTSQPPNNPTSQPPNNRLQPQVLLFGFVSLLNDAASEMIYPLLPVFLTTTLGATPVIVGIIEGAADGLASILKYFAGSISDRLPLRSRLELVD